MLSKELRHRALVDPCFHKAMEALQESTSTKLSPYIRIYKKEAEKQPQGFEPLSSASLYEIFKHLLDPIEEASRVHGKAARKAALRTVNERYQLMDGATRGEMDALRTPIAIQHELRDECIGLPLEYMLMHVNHRGIAGHWLEFGRVGERTSHIIQMLKHAHLPKRFKPKDESEFNAQDYEHIRYGVQTQNPFYGVLDIIASDPGPAFVSRGLLRFCLEYLLNYMIEQSGSPWLRPFIERFFYTYVTMFVCTLPGFLPDVDGYAEGKRGLNEMCVLNKIEYTKLSKCFINDVYHNKPHKGLFGKTPLESFYKVDPFNRPPLPQNAGQMACHFAPYKKATLTKDRGFQIDNRFYHDSNITNDLYRLIKREGKSLQNMVYIDAEDLSLVKYLNPVNNELIDIPFSSYAHGIDANEQFDAGISTYVDEEYARIRNMTKEEIINHAKKRKHDYRKKRKEERRREQEAPVDEVDLSAEHAEIAFGQRIEKSILTNKTTQKISSQLTSEDDEEFDLENERNMTKVG